MAKSNPIVRKQFVFIMSSNAPTNASKHVRLITPMRPIDAYNYMLKENGNTVSWTEMLDVTEYDKKYNLANGLRNGQVVDACIPLEMK